MTRELTFYKNHQGWFVDLPEWEGDQAELAMVAGADDMLDLFSQGEDEIKLKISDKNNTTGTKLIFQNKNGSGADYIMPEYKGMEYNLPVWLCHVTEFVFDDFPEVIYVG